MEALELDNLIGQAAVCSVPPYTHREPRRARPRGLPRARRRELAQAHAGLSPQCQSRQARRPPGASRAAVHRGPGFPAGRAALWKHLHLDPPPLAGEGRGAASGGLGRAPWTSRTADASQSVRRDTDISRYRARLTVPWAGRSHFRRSALYAPPAEKTQPAPIEHPPRPRPRQHAQYQQPFEVL
jgi:hypothetical protein